MEIHPKVIVQQNTEIYPLRINVCYSSNSSNMRVTTTIFIVVEKYVGFILLYIN